MDLGILEEQMGRTGNRKFVVGGQLRRAICSYTQGCESSGKLFKPDAVPHEEPVEVHGRGRQRDQAAK